MSDPVVVLTRRVELEPDRASARMARRFVRNLLEDVGRAEWVEAAELAVSEVVTNGVLHAHTAMQVQGQVTEHGLRIEVHDDNPAVPVPREYDEQATTGRGMDLVAAMTTASGVLPVPGDGKVVWFCLGDDAAVGTAADRAGASTLQVTDDVGTGDAEPPGPTGVRVALRGLPPLLWLAARQHHDALLREFVLYRPEHFDAGEVAEVDLVQADRARSLVGEVFFRALDQAKAEPVAQRLPPGHPAGLPAVPLAMDLELVVDTDQTVAFTALQDVLDLAERLAAADLLLVRPGLPEVIAVRDWACEQVVAQVAGVPAVAWSHEGEDRFSDRPHDRFGVAQPPWDDRVVREATHGVVAADDANRIIAISDPLAAAVGWRPADLVGRRVVALIPPRLREAHVAGFSRHLSTGQAHVLDVPLVLPVLRADGTEVICNFLVQQASLAAGRAVYLAWIDPVQPVPTPAAAAG